MLRWIRPVEFALAMSVISGFLVAGCESQPADAQPPVATAPEPNKLPEETIMALRAVVGKTSDESVFAQVKRLYPGAKEKWVIRKAGNAKEIRIPVHEGGAKDVLNAPIGKLPIGIYIAGRAEGGKGPGYLKLSGMKDKSLQATLKLLSDVTGISPSQLKMGLLVDSPKGKVRTVEGTSFVIYASSWAGDPNTETDLVFVGLRPEDIALVNSP